MYSNAATTSPSSCLARRSNVRTASKSATASKPTRAWRGLGAAWMATYDCTVMVKRLRRDHVLNLDSILLAMAYRRTFVMTPRVPSLPMKSPFRCSPVLSFKVSRVVSTT